MPIEWNKPEETPASAPAQPTFAAPVLPAAPAIPAPAVASPPVSSTDQFLFDDPNNPNVMMPSSFQGTTLNGWADTTPNKQSLTEMFVGKKMLDFVQDEKAKEIKWWGEPHTAMEKVTHAVIEPDSVLIRAPSYTVDIVKGALNTVLNTDKAPMEVLQNLEKIYPGISSKIPFGTTALALHGGVELMQKRIDALEGADSGFMQGVGTTIPFLAGGFAGAAAELPAWAIAGGLGAAAESSSLSDEAQAAGASGGKALIAEAMGIPLGATEAIEGGWFVKRANLATKGKLAEFLAKNNYFSDMPSWIKGEAVKGFIAEGGQELGQTLGENIVAKDIAGYDPNRSLSDNLTASLLTGGIIGSVMGWGIGKIRSENKQSLLDDYLLKAREAAKAGGINALEPGVPFTPLQDFIFLNKERNDILARQAAEGQQHIADMEQLLGRGADVPLDTIVAGKAQGADLAPVNLSGVSGVTPTTLPVQNQLPHLDEIDWDTNPDFRDFLAGTTADVRVHPKNQNEAGESYSILEALKTNDVVFSEIDPYVDQIAGVKEQLATAQMHLDRVQGPNATGKTTRERVKALENGVKLFKSQLQELQEKTKITRQLATHVRDYVASMRTAFGEGTKFVVTDGSYLNESPLFTDATASPNTAGAIYHPLYNVPLSDDGTVTGRVAIMYLKLDPMATKLWEDRKLQKDMLKNARAAGVDKQGLKALRQNIKSRPWYQNSAARQLFSTVSHEVGHNLISRHVKDLIEKAKAGDRDSAGIFFNLMDEYESWLKQAAGSPLAFFTQTVAGAAYLQGYVGQAAGTNATTQGLGMRPDKAAEYTKYLYNFDEFFAERTARMITATDSTLSSLLGETKFYKEVAGSFKSFFDALPNELKSIYNSNWMDYLRAQGIGAKLEELRGEGPITLLDLLRGNKTAIGLSPEDYNGLQAALDTWSWVNEKGQTLLQNAADNPHVAALQAYRNLVVQWAAFVRTLTATTNKIIKDINNAGKGTSARLSEVLFDEAKTKKRLTMEQLAAKLEPHEAELYQAIRKELDRVLAMMKEITIADARSIYAEHPEQLQTRLEEIEKEFTKMQRQAYFPFMRFGKYTIYGKAKVDMVFEGEAVKKGETLTFQTFESESDRDTHLNQLFTEIGSTAALSKGIMSDTEFAIQGMPRSMLIALRRSMEGEDASPEQLAVIDRALESTTPFQSFKKQWVKKKGIHGYSEDMLRSFASYMRMASGHMARVQYAPQLFGQVRQMGMDMQVMREVGEPTQKRQQMRDWMAKHFSYIMNPTNEWTALRGAISMAYLGLNIKSAALQLVQLPQVVYPYLAARYGDAAAVTALTKAPWTLRDYIMNPLDFKQLPEKMNPLLKGTKMVNEKGEPILVYATGEELPDGQWGRGFYTSDAPHLDDMKPVYLNIKNPATNDTLNLPEVQDEMELLQVVPAALQKVLQKMGYDGLVIQLPEGDTFRIAFSPEQIIPADGEKAKAPTEKARIGMMLAQGEQEQWLDQSYATELALAASENNLDRGLALGSYLQSKTKRMWHKSTSLLMLPFHVTEKANRYITAVAAYKLAYERTGDHVKSVLAAREANWSANFEYARWNRPEFSRGKKSVALMFSSFWQNSLYFATKDPGAMRYWLMMLYLAGLLGLPFADDLKDLLNSTLTYFREKLGYKNPYVDLDTEARQFLQELGAPSTVADYLLHGVSQDDFGLGLIDTLLGIPIPHFDLSASVGVGDIIPGTDIPMKQLDARGMPSAGDDLLANAAKAGMGATGSLAMSLVNASISGNVDDWKQGEKLLPFMFARNASKAFRLGQQGVEKTQAGEPIATFDTTNPRDIAELVGQGLGFTPKKTSQGWQEYMATKGLIRYYESQKRILQMQLNQSFMQEDREARADILHKIGEFNKSVPYPEFVLADPSKGVEDYMKRQIEAGVLGINDKRYLRIKKQLGATYGTEKVMKSFDTSGTGDTSPP